MQKANFEENQSRKINRTICIGLGGTGRDVLMRIRRLIVDRYGDFKQLPVISFVHIDTDKATSNITGLRTGNFYHGVDLRFSDAEKVAATMTRSQVDNMVKELQRRSNNYEGSPGVYKNIQAWFPPQLLKNLKAIDEGAQAIRPVGRLAFFHNYRKIKAAIESAEKRTRGHNAVLLRKGLSVDNKLNIFVVGSLCGGTGSGICLDVAYCLRQMYGKDGAQITGYLVTSPELYGDAPNKHANTYAALKELNYYASAGTTFKAEYDLQNIEYVEESRPPFEYVYLISNRTAKDYRILEKSKLCNVIAHKITLDFIGELAPNITAHRDNFLQHMIRTDEHPRPNVQRYLTFGLAEIYFPRDVAVQVSLNRIKIKLVDFWRQGEGQSADPCNLLTSFVDRWYEQGTNENSFASKLQQAVTDGSKTFKNSLSSWRNRLETNISEIKSKDEREEVILQLGREIRSEFRKVQPGETDSSRGLWLTNLQQERDRLTTKYIQDIDKYLTELLNPHNLNFSLTNTRAWLEALTTELNKSYRELEDKVNSLGKVNSLEGIERKWKEAEQTITDIESKRGLPLFNKQKNSQIQEEAKRVVGQVSKLIKQNFEFSLVREALAIVKALQNHVSELTTKTSAFNNLLSNVQLAYEKTENELKRLDVDGMSGEAIFADADTDNCYQNLLPEHDRATQLALVSSKITEKVGLGESLGSCLDRGVIDEQQLQTEIDLVVDGLFGSKSLSNVQSAVKRFLESYSLGDRSIRLEQILREGEPLLPLNTSDPYFFDDPDKSKNIIGFKDTDKREVTQFKNILFQELGVPNDHLRSIQAAEEIIFVSEYGGFPLRIIAGLEQMREHYHRQKTYQQTNGECFLHNDYRTQFIDIIPPDAREISNLQDIFYSSLAFELLPYDSKTQTYQLQHYDSFRDTHKVTSLSHVWDEALEKLASLQDMVEALDTELNKAIADITHNPQNWQGHYLPKLRKFVDTVDELPKDDPNYLYKETVVGTKPGIGMNTKQQDGVVNRFWRRMEEIVREELDKYNQKQQQQKLAGSPPNNPILSSASTPPEEKEIDLQQHQTTSIMDADFEDKNSLNQPTEDIETQLKKYKIYLDKGLITQAKYDEAVNSLLGI